ncbi:hypothetical protein [Actinomyces sp.]|uniref:hypothetical protein n=1 Tax=Actinomyces sp. TaxID=29317 RepID=UPI0026DB947B|nr:hypothetical protein [Actinomyces sp.]MDO4899714.1 hypothetical protein [Actinomyces sp.]
MCPSADSADPADADVAPSASLDSRSADDDTRPDRDPEFPPPPASPIHEAITETRTVTDLLRGLRAGGLITAIGAGVQAMSQESRNPGMLEAASGGLTPMLALLTPVAVLVWVHYARLVAVHPRHDRTRAATLLVLLLAVVPAFAVTVLFGRLWLRQSGAIGMDYPVLFPLTITAAGLALTIAADVLLRLARKQHPAGRQKLRRRLRLTPTALAAAAITLLIAASTLTLPSLSFPVRARSVWLTAVRPVAVPDTVDDDVAWQRVFEETEPVLGVIAGTFSPLVITDHGVLGLDPNSGYTDWIQTRPASTIKIGDCDGGQQEASCYAALSPNRAHLVIAYDAGPTRTLFVGIDTATGRIAFEHMRHHSNHDWSGRENRLQITDHVLMVDDEVLSLADGSVLATAVPEARFPVCEDDWGCATSGWEPASFFQGGHSTLIVGAYCPSDRRGWCELALAPDVNPTAITIVGGVVPAGSQASPVVVDGWTVRYRDPDAVKTELVEQATGAAEAVTHPLDAVSLDSLSGAAPTPVVPLGNLAAPVREHATRTLRVQAGSSAGSADVVFEPATGKAGTVQELSERASGRGYLDALATRRSGSTSSPEEVGFDVVAPDGTVAVHLDPEDIEGYTAVSAADQRYLNDGYLAPAPGIIALVCSRSAAAEGPDGSARASSGAGNSGSTETVVVGLSNRPAATMSRPA